MRWLKCAQGLLLFVILASNTVAVAHGRDRPSGNAVTQWNAVAIEVFPVPRGPEKR